MRFCLYVLCGHLLGKGRPLGSRLWCLTVSLSLSHWYPGSGVVLDCDVKVPLPSLGSVYGTRPSSLVVEKVETGCPILVLHHVAPGTGGYHRRLMTGTVAVYM